MARGHDGFLRGHPEPVLVVGHFRVAAGRAVPEGRMIARFAVQGQFPLVAPPMGNAVLRTRLRGRPEHGLLVLALEADGGFDVQRLYAAFDEPLAVAVWNPEDDHPAPVALAAALTGPRACRVRVLDRLTDLGERCGSDELIGCQLVPLGTKTRRDEFRLSFASDDGRNSWTAVLMVTVT